MKTIIASACVALGLLLTAGAQAATPVVSGENNASVATATGKVKPAKRHKHVKRHARKAVVNK